MAEDKKKAKARIIQEYLPRCSRYKCYTQGEIPMSKFEKARESYASGVSYRDVLGMIDESFLETAVRIPVYGRGILYKGFRWLHPLPLSSTVWSSSGL